VGLPTPYGRDSSPPLPQCDGRAVFEEVAYHFVAHVGLYARRNDMGWGPPPPAPYGRGTSPKSDRGCVSGSMLCI